jgi:hypothetical protein
MKSNSQKKEPTLQSTSQKLFNDFSNETYGVYQYLQNHGSSRSASQRPVRQTQVRIGWSCPGEWDPTKLQTQTDSVLSDLV